MIGKKFILAALLAPWLLSMMLGLGHAAGGFLSGAEDLPLMPGLHEVPEATLIFDKPAGRLIRAMARGESNPAQCQTIPDG